jgi:adenylate kinase family enzyme
VLITGMSGTGKSTVIPELVARGSRAIDTSWNPEWEEPPADGSGPGWIWREDRIATLLRDEGSGMLFLAACVENQGKFYRRFDQVVLLTASEELIRERLATRTTNRYGRRPEELVQVLGFKETVEPLLRRSATFEIDTAIPVDEVLALLISLASPSQGGRRHSTAGKGIDGSTIEGGTL